MRCTNCNSTDHEPGAKFCHVCGCKLSNSDGSPIELDDASKYKKDYGTSPLGQNTHTDLPLMVKYGNVFCKMTRLAGGTGYTGAIDIPPYIDGQKVTAIGERAFWGDSGLISVTIPNTVTHIGYEAFYNCGLLGITIPDSVVSIGDRAFSGCSNLIDLVIPNSVVSIGFDAFSYCQSLTSIVIPRSVRKIGQGAFAYCNARSIIVPPTVESIGAGAFSCNQEIDIPVSVVFPRKFLCKSLIRGIWPSGLTLGEICLIRKIIIKDEDGNVVNYKDLPDDI